MKKTILLILVSTILISTIVAFSTIAFARGFQGQNRPKFPFNQVDKNNNKSISMEEWNSFHSKLFSEIDEDGDGEITESEIKNHHENKRMRNR